MNYCHAGLGVLAPCAVAVQGGGRALKSSSSFVPHFMRLTAMQAWACWRTVRWLFLTAVPFKLLNDGAQFVGPFFLNKLLDVIQAGDAQV